MLRVFCLLLALTAQLAFGQTEPALDPRVAKDLFDGTTLKGWTDRGGRYVGTARWTVEDGLLVGRQGPGKSGGLLYTEATYADVLVSVEVKIDWPFDSGLFFRMVPTPGPRGVQVTLDAREGGQIGGLYADGWLHEFKPGMEQWKKEDWNRVTVRCAGAEQRVSVWLNGRFLHESALPPGTEGYARSGRFGIQVHGGENVPDETAVRFRSIRLIELPAADAALFRADDRGRLLPTERAKSEGWIDLFANPDRLDGLGSDQIDPETGILALRQSGADLVRTKDEYGNFAMRIDFEIARMANSGLYLRGSGGFPGQELQILDDFHWEAVTKSKLLPYQFTGGLYYFRGPDARQALRPLLTWNTYEVQIIGDRLTAKLNGEPLHDAELAPLWRTKDQAFPAKGTIALQRHAPAEAGDQPFIRFRNAWLRPLP